MRILVVVYQWSRAGGLEAVMVEVVKALQAHGANVSVLSVHQSGLVLQDGILANGFAPTRRVIKPLYYRGLWKPLLARRLSRIASAFDIVVVGHANLLKFVLQGLDRISSSRPPCWVWTYGIEVWGSSGCKLHPYLEGVERVVSISSYTADQLSRYIDRDRIIIIPPMVDTALFTPTKTPNRIQDNKVLIVGRLASSERYKGHEVLMRALPLVEARYSIVPRLDIVGDGNDRTRLQTVAADLKLGHRVRFLGRLGIAELVDAYQHCAVFAMPSRVDKSDQGYWTGEGFGITYIEGAACGRPVIASIEGGAAETIIPEKTGFLVDPRDPSHVADAIGTLLRDCSLRDDYGRSGRIWVEENFSLVRFRERLGKLLL